MKYDPNVGQSDDPEALIVLEESLSGWSQQLEAFTFDPHVSAVDLLVDLPRRGWHLTRIEKTVRLEDCDILVGIEWQPATAEGFIPGQVYRVRER